MDHVAVIIHKRKQTYSQVALKEFYSLVLLSQNQCSFNKNLHAAVKTFPANVTSLKCKTKIPSLKAVQVKKECLFC